MKLPVEPFREWALHRIAVCGGAGQWAAIVEADEAQVRRWAGHGKDAPDRISIDTADRACVNDGTMSIWQLWPELDELVDDCGPEQFCYACRAFATPVAGLCPWCDAPTARLHVADLPPRRAPRSQRPARATLRTARGPRTERAFTPLPRPPAPMLVPPVRRGPGTGAQGKLDTDLSLRRIMLETYVELGAAHPTAVRLQHLVDPPPFSSSVNGAGSIRRFLSTRGWEDRAVVDGLLAHGGWDAPRQARERKAPLPEWLVREAAFIYFVDEVGFLEVAKRLGRHSPYRNAHVFSRALLDEWNWRGWPRRTQSSATAARNFRHGLSGDPDWRRMKRRQAQGGAKPRCQGVTAQGKRAGKRCLRPAHGTSRYCLQHDPDQVELRRQMAAQRHQTVQQRMVPAAPFAWWLRHRAGELGSLRAVARRLGGAANYQALSRIARPTGELDLHATVTRDFVDRVLDAWGDGVSFEDIYLPVDDEPNALTQAA